MSKEVNVKFGGWGVVLSIVFFVAKVAGYIDWSWAWVFAPIWLPFVFISMVVIFFILLEAIA